MLKDKIRTFLFGAACGVALSIPMGYLCSYFREPDKVYMEESFNDYNKDRIPDIVVQQRGGRKFPMFGMDCLKDKIGPKDCPYVSASQMEGIQEKSIENLKSNFVNYDAIQKILNK